jgi:hypothetical protein
MKHLRIHPAVENPIFQAQHRGKLRKASFRSDLRSLVDSKPGDEERLGILSSKYIPTLWLRSTGCVIGAFGASISRP